MRVKITLDYTECKQHNYNTMMGGGGRGGRAGGGRGRPGRGETHSSQGNKITEVHHG